MKYIISGALILFITVFYIAVSLLPNLRSEFYPVLAQEVRESKIDYYSKLYTYVWHNGTIVWSRIDDADSLTDSLVIVRKKEANEFIKALNEINK